MSKRTLKDWFYLEMVSHRAIDDIMQTRKKEVHFFFFSVCCIVFNCSWQLIMFDKKQKSCVKRIHFVTDDSFYDRKAFYTVKIVFYSSSTNDGELINYKWYSAWVKLNKALKTAIDSLFIVSKIVITWSSRKRREFINH